MTLPPGMLDQPQASALLQAPPGMAAAPAPMAAEPQALVPPEPVVEPERDVLAGIDPNDAIALATRSAEVSRDVQRANLAEAQRLDVAVREEAEKQERRLAERAEREERARERVAAQNAEVQAALRAGPEGTWRDVARTGTEALFAVLGAAFDRSGLLQQALPQTLNGIMQQGQERVQSAFARQLQALQVGREQAGDELDAAMDDERRIDAAGAAARTALIEESMRQMDLAVQQGKVDLATLEAAGIPAQMTAQLTEAQAKQRALQMEEQRKAEKEALAARKTEAEIAASKANTSQGWARINLDKQKQAADERRLNAQEAKDALEANNKALDVKLKAKELDAKDLNRAVVMPSGTTVLLNSTAEGSQKQAVAKIATARKLGRLVDEITAKGDQAYDPRWIGSPEGQKTRLRWRKLWLSVKDQEELGAVAGTDAQTLDDVTGDDPTGLSAEARRGTTERLQLLKRMAEDEVDDYLYTASVDYRDKKERFKLSERTDPADAAASADEVQNRLALKPGKATGSVPKLDAKEVSSYVQQLRADIDRQQSAGKLTDRVTGQPVGKRGVLIEQAERLVDTYKTNRGTGAEIGREIDRLRATKGLPVSDINRMVDLIQAQKNLESTNARIAVELERERKFLKDRAERSDATVADKAALEAVEAVIGQYGKQSKGRDALKARGEDR